MLQAINQGLTDVSTTQKVQLGATYEYLGNVYIYLQGVASVAVGSWVTYNSAFATALLTTTEAAKLKPMAVAMAAIVANDYGWFQIFGEASVLALANGTAETALYTSATAGSSDIVSTSQTKINRAIYRAAVGASNGKVAAYIAYPSAA